MCYYREAGLISFTTVLIFGWFCFYHHGRAGQQEFCADGVYKWFDGLAAISGEGVQGYQTILWLYRNCLFAISASFVFQDMLLRDRLVGNQVCIDKILLFLLSGMVLLAVTGTSICQLQGTHRLEGPRLGRCPNTHSSWR